jgi:hypothetical protein
MKWELTTAVWSWWGITDTFKETSASILRLEDKMEAEVSFKKVLKSHSL